jgi:hypothetical protein
MQDRGMVCVKCTIAQKSLWTHLIVLLGDVDEVKAHFDPFGDSFNFGARKVTVCAECTTGLEIALGTTDGTL